MFTRLPDDFILIIDNAFFIYRPIGLKIKKKGAHKGALDLFRYRVKVYFSIISSALVTILSAVKPYFCSTVPPGAEAPKRSIPMTLPCGPT